jgi:class 3 adenylate cyclase/tetratricopeptide (TPR) repeat protein
VTCPSCQAENRPGRKFCVRCGTPLERACPSCGTPAEPDDVFCGECGASLSPAAGRTDAIAGVGTAARQREVAAAAGPESERRLVSVLFADLVGFTTLSESRDPEEVRELLSAYFDTCRRLIDRYGGTVEKFIGDAVMAVWGTPVAQEDDAERAVRAALDLTEAVSALGRDSGAPDLRARAGVLTGDAAVTLGATDQGMVAGDLVNTAARIQAAAGPGHVLVGDTTRRSTDSSIVYEDAGSHEMKGKAEPMRLWRAARVVAKVGGGLRSEGLEAPFVGRDRELRMLKDLFHATADERHAHLVSVTGVAGVGKSRLGWEFYKYLDGLATTIRWHRGRCLAYGEGVTYWALAEMVRTRAGIVEGENTDTARELLRGAVEDTFPDPEERRFVEPRLAHLLGLEEHVAREREDLFAAWRMFYERLADEMPTIMLFEDMQWADPSLLDFLDYLLDWSRGHALYVVTLARPDLTEKRPNWGTGRGATSLSLEPLSDEGMGALLDGLAPGLPDDLRARILERSQGIPLYAIETVRMLLDRGALVAEEGAYRPSGDVTDLEVPETLHALIAARLDGLAPDERRLVQDASVLGKTFTRVALAALSGHPEDVLAPLLSSLVRKEVFSIQSDPLSPERGQYGFLQDLVRAVAYETLSRRDRKARHLAVAEHLAAEWGDEDEEIVEVVASHYVEALEAVPDAEDAADIRARARSMLTRAGERAASLAAGEEAMRYFAQGVEMADLDEDRAALHERAGEMAATAGKVDRATEHFDEAMRLFEELGMIHAAARVSARLGDVDAGAGRLEEGVQRMQGAYDVLSSDPPDEDLARLAAQLARLRFLRGEMAEVGPVAEVALDIAEKQWLPEILSEALNTKAVVAIWLDHPEEAFALLTHALRVALENDVPAAALRAYGNLGETMSRRDRFEEALDTYLEAITLARRVGNRTWETYLHIELTYVQMQTGRWDEALETADQLWAPTGGDPTRSTADTLLSSLPEIYSARGQADQVESLQRRYADSIPSDDVQGQGVFRFVTGLVALLNGRHEEAFDLGMQAIEVRNTLGWGFQGVKQGFVLAVEAAIAGGDPGRAEEVLGLLADAPPAQVSPFYTAHRDRFRALLAVARREPAAADAGFKASIGMFRELGLRPRVAMTQTEYAEWLVAQGRAEDAHPLLTAARETLDHLRAEPWLRRLAAAEHALGLAPASS